MFLEVFHRVFAVGSSLIFLCIILCELVRNQQHAIFVTSLLLSPTSNICRSLIA